MDHLEVPLLRTLSGSGPLVISVQFPYMGRFRSPGRGEVRMGTVGNMLAKRGSKPKREPALWPFWGSPFFKDYGILFKCVEVILF